MTKQHDQTTNARSLVQKSRLERYLEITAFLWTKKPPFDKTTSTNRNTNVSFTEKQARKILATSEQNHGLTRFDICKFFDNRKMSFLRTKKPPFDKTT